RDGGRDVRGSPFETTLGAWTDSNASLRSGLAVRHLSPTHPSPYPIGEALVRHRGSSQGTASLTVNDAQPLVATHITTNKSPTAFRLRKNCYDEVSAHPARS